MEEGGSDGDIETSHAGGRQPQRNERDLRNVQETRAEPATDELEARPHSDWIKVEPEDSFDLRNPVGNISDEEITEHEDLDDDHEDGIVGGEDWADLFEPTNAGNSAAARTPSTLVCSSIYLFILGTQRVVTKTEARMGENDAAMEYDPIDLFRHLYVANTLHPLV